MRKENGYAVFPVLGAWYPVLMLVASNVGAGAGASGVWTTLFLATLLGLIFWLVTGLVTRDADRRVLISLGFVALWSSYDFLQGVTGASVTAPAVPLALLATCFIAVSFVLTRKLSAIPTISRGARVAVVILMGFAVASLLSANRGNDELPAGVAPPVGPPSPTNTLDRPSIYFIVLDKYTGRRSLAANYGFDNAPFEDQLRERGLVVPDGMRSNYPHTWFALPSMLNWSHVDELVDERPQSAWKAHMAALVEDNRTWRFLRRLGYEFIVLPSTFPLTQHNRFADRQLPRPRPRRGVDIGVGWMTTTPLSPLLSVIAETPLSPLLSAIADGVAAPAFPYPIESAAAIEEKFATLARLAAEPKPLFVFAHLLIPHEPYVFAADCTPQEPYWPATDYVDDQETIKKAYTDQITCLNRQLLDVIDQILQHSRQEPIIILQSDHGHALMAVNPITGEQRPLNQLSPAQIAERTDVFAAYYLPGGGDAAIYEGMTPVNLFPAIFNFYFDAELPFKEERVYWSYLHPPFNMVRLR